ncbi:MAG: RNA methyltransferase substrate-binding domain-containing protein [Anaerovoracaceae bacterium]
MSNILFGRNPVLEALKSGREIEKLVMQKGGEGSAKRLKQ